MARRGAVAGVALLAAVALAAAVAVPRPDPGPIVRTVPLPQPAYRPVIDARTGRAFIDQVSSGEVRVFDTRTGALLRTIATATPGASSTYVQLVGDEGLGRVYALSEPDNGPVPSVGHVRILDARSGRVLAVTPVMLAGFENYLAIDARARRLFLLGVIDPSYAPPAPTPTGTLVAARLTILDATDGRVVRALALPARHVAIGNGSFGFHLGLPIAVDERASRVYVSAFDRSSIYSIDASSGHIIQALTLPSPTPAPPLAPTRIWSGLFEDDRLRRLVAIGGEQGAMALTTIDTARGRALRSVPVGPYAYPVFDAPTRRIFVSNASTGAIALLDAATGRPLRTLPGPAISMPFPSYPIVVDERSGHVLLANPVPGTIDVLDGASGWRLHTTATGPNLAGLALDEGNGRIFATSLGPLNRARQLVGEGRLWVVDAGTGAVLRTLLVGAAPSGVALDARAGRALVLSSGGVSVSPPDPWGWIPPWLRRALPFLPRHAPAARPAPPSLTVIDTSRL